MVIRIFADMPILDDKNAGEIITEVKFLHIDFQSIDNFKRALHVRLNNLCMSLESQILELMPDNTRDA